MNKRNLLYLYYKNLPPFLYGIHLKYIYKKKTGKNLNLSNPRRLTEKIQWLKLNDNLPIKTTLSDKLLVRDWVKEKIPEIKFPKVFTVGKSYDDLDFSSCPQNFLIKTNHAWKQNFWVNGKDTYLANKSYQEKTRLLLKYYLSRTFAFESGFELQYKNIDRKVYAEEIIGDKSALLSCDYKVLCFNGVPKLVEHYIISMKDRSLHMNMYDIKGNKLNVSHTLQMYEEQMPLPKCFDKLIEYAKILSEGFKFVRVDFMVYDENIYFSEMTFTPSSGFMKFIPEEYDEIFGDMLKLD